MSAVNELLQSYYASGTEPYYRTLYLKHNKQQTQLLILLHDIIFSILYSSDDANIRQKKLEWWANECQNSLFSLPTRMSVPSNAGAISGQTPCSQKQARHPITQALDGLSVDELAFNQFFNELMQLSQNKVASNNVAKNSYCWLIMALAPNTNDNINNSLATILYNYQALKNTALNFSFAYKSNPRLPKYLNTNHLYGENSQVINDYIENEIHIITAQLKTLKGQKLPQVFITQLLLIEKTLKTVIKNPKAIYNNKEHLSPLKQLFCSYFSKNKTVF